MKTVIVGLGYFGSIIKSKLSEESVTVDLYNENATYKSIDDVPFNDGKWFITTPATTHHGILIQLFDRGVKDVWVEKPICSKFEDTLDVFSKIPADVFMYCDFTWICHPAVRKLGQCQNIKHMELKWLNDGTMIPNDVNIVLDLVIHPLSIITYLLLKSRDRIMKSDITYATKDSVLIQGISHNGLTFNIEVSNSSKVKQRGISLYCTDNVYRWYSTNESYIENIGKVEKTDAIQNNIECFFNRINIVYPLDIAHSLEEINKQFSILCH